MRRWNCTCCACIETGAPYAAINVCAIATWLQHAAREYGQALDRDDLDGLLRESAEVVRRAGERDRKAPGDLGYWACTSLAELALCEGKLDEAKREYVRAAHWPGRGKFDIQSMLSHLRVYKELGLHVETTSELVEFLEGVSQALFASEAFDKVAVCLGHMTDEPKDPGFAFDDDTEPLKQVIAGKLREWDMGPGHLAICRGVRGAETIFAEACVNLRMTVRLLIPLPEDEFIETCVHAPGTEWQTRYTRLIAAKMSR